MHDTDLKSEAQRQWDAAAPGWAKWEGVFARGLAEITDAMLDRAGVRTGGRVLDLACGAGSQTVEAARRVGPSGRIVAADISATMLEHLRSRAERAGLDIGEFSKRFERRPVSLASGRLSMAGTGQGKGRAR